MRQQLLTLVAQLQESGRPTGSWHKPLWEVEENCSWPASRVPWDGMPKSHAREIARKQLRVDGTTARLKQEPWYWYALWRSGIEELGLGSMFVFAMDDSIWVWLELSTAGTPATERKLSNIRVCTLHVWNTSRQINNRFSNLDKLQEGQNNHLVQLQH